MPRLALPLLLLLAIASPVTAQSRAIRVCVVESGRLAEVSAQYNPATGDTTVAGRTFASAYPAGRDYAAGALWFVNSETITVGGRSFVKYGLPRVLGVTEVSRSGEHQGVPVFVEAGAGSAAEVLYLPVRPGCEFQPYTLGVQSTPIQAGETVRGTLSGSDPVLEDD